MPTAARLLSHERLGGESPAHLHDKGLLGRGKVCQQVQVQRGTQIVRVGDKQVLDAALDQTIQHARAQQGRIDVTMTWWTPANHGQSSLTLPGLSHDLQCLPWEI